MGKLLKWIIRVVLGLVILVVILVGVLAFLTYDTSSISFTPDENPKSIEEYLGDDVYDSLNVIKDIPNDERTTSDDNKLEISLTETDLNNILTSFIRSNYNENYLKEGDSVGIVGGSGVSLSSLTFTELDGKLAVYGKVDLFGFYSSSLTLSGTPSMEGNVLKIKFESFRMGKRLTLSASRVADLLGKLNINLGGNDTFDVKTLTLSFDLSSFLNGVSPLFSDFLTACEYDCSYTEAKEETEGSLKLSVDTKKIFTPVKDIPSASLIYTIPAESIAELALLGKADVVISEKDFNRLVKENIDLASFSKSVTLGTKEFGFSLADLYYNVDSGEVLGIAAINNAKTNMTADVTVTPVKADEYISNVNLTVSALMIGETSVNATDFFNEISIPSSTLTGGMDGVSIKDFTVNKDDETVTISYVRA